MAVSKRVRFEVLRRDGHRCRYCGATADDAKLTVDHVVPRALGGTDDPSNLVCACAPCNSGKTSIQPDSELVADVDEFVLQFAMAIEHAAHLRRRIQDELDDQTDIFEVRWSRWSYDTATGTQDVPLPPGWRSSIERFLELGLDHPDMERYIEIAMGSKAPARRKFDYFCGCSWNEIRARQELARTLVTAGGDIW